MKLKNILTPMLVGLGLVAMTSCSDDNGSNPTLHMPASFKLNKPALSESAIDLKTTEDPIVLTWSQPDYGGFPAATLYYVEYAIDPSFEPQEEGGIAFILDDEPLTTCRAEIAIDELNRHLVEMLGITSEEQVPAEVEVFFRIAAQTASTDAIYSNLVSVKTVPYYQALVAADPILWYMTGSCIGDGSWQNDVPTGCMPMYFTQASDYDYSTGAGEIVWAGYLTSSGFKFRGSPDDGWAVQIGQGDSFGEYKLNDGGSANISVPEDGCYMVILDTKTNLPNITPYEGTVRVFDGIALSGSFNGWGDTEMTPITTACENHDWYMTIDLAAGDLVKFKQTGSWDFNWGGSFSTFSTGYYGNGVGNGDNLYIAEGGTYDIYFNDITGIYRFVRK